MATEVRPCLSCHTEVAADATFCSQCGARLMVPPLLGGKYRLDQLIGSGGMGHVYRAEHVLLERTVAVKILRPELTASPEMMARFRREAVATSRLVHPSIVAALDFGLDPGGAYFVMEWIDGVPLDAVLTAAGPLPVDQALAVTAQIADALAAAHRHGVVHRDIKPANVMTVRPREPLIDKVVDFGIAHLAAPATVSASPRLTHVGHAMGTPAYLAPEQVSGLTVDARSDLYALGAVLYELLTGIPPFGQGSVAETVHHHLHSRPAPPSWVAEAEVPPEVDALILRLLAKRPDDRPGSAEEVAAALRALRSPAAQAHGPALALVDQRRAVAVINLGDLDDDVVPGGPAASRLAQAIADRAGVLARAVGDELFGHFDEVHAAVAAAEEIIAVLPRARVCVHRGVIQVGAGGGIFGEPVNLALRVARLADPGTILLTADAAGDAGLAVAARLGRHGDLAGAGRTTVELHRVMRPARTPPDGITVPAARVGDELRFTCSCGSACRAPARLLGARAQLRCGACSQPLSVVLADDLPIAPTVEVEAIDGIDLDGGFVADPDRSLLAALASVE